MILVNGSPGASMRWVAEWSGVWVAEVDLMPTSSTDTLPSGRVSITSSNGIALSGTVDQAYSEAFADRRHVRVLGGAGGWGSAVRAQHYHAAETVQLREVLSTTAAEVGESVVLFEPRALGQDFVRHAGPASQVFADLGVDWWVDALGITRVGTRPTFPARADVRVLDWAPSAGTLSFTADALVEPGTLITDARFGTRVVRKVEAEIADATVTGRLYVSDAAPARGAKSAIVDAIESIAREATGAKFARFYEYTVDAARGYQAELVSASKGVPNLIPADVWSGISGYRSILRPGARVLVGFRDGDLPFVAFYQPPDSGEWRPLELEVDAVEKVTVGATALGVELGGGAGEALSVARAPAVQAFADAVGSAVNVAAAALTANAAPITGAQVGAIIATMGASIVSASTTMAATLASERVRVK